MTRAMEHGWRNALVEHLPAISAVSDAVHGRYSENIAVYAERLSLYPQGCFVFAWKGDVAGYLISHPASRGCLPHLGDLLGALPAQPDAYYLHDVVLLPTARGLGAGGAATRLTVDLARAGGFGEICLVALGGLEDYWSSQGFSPVPERVDASYGAGARLMRRPV